MSPLSKKSIEFDFDFSFSFDGGGDLLLLWWIAGELLALGLVSRESGLLKDSN